MTCELCGGSGLRLVYVLRPYRTMPNGSVLKLNPEPLSPERYRELARTLPTSPLDWRPGMEGVLSTQSVRCGCKPAPVLPGRPKARKAKKPVMHVVPARWWEQ